MKNTIKYAGIAAATLLAVAPVVAPVVGSTTSIQTALAADSKVDTPKEIETFFSQFGDKEVKSFDDLAKDETYAKATAYSDFIANGNKFYELRKNNALEAPKLSTEKVTVAALGKDKSALSANDFRAVVKDGAEKTITFQITVSYKNDKGTEDTKSTLVKVTKTDAPVVETNEVKQINATFDNPYKVALDSKTLAVKLSGSAKVTLTSQDKKEIKTNGLELSGLYKSFSGAKNLTEGDLYKDAKFTEKGKTYYQAVTVDIPLAALGTVAGSTDKNKFVAIEDIATNYEAGKDGYAITINGVAAAKNAYTAVNGTPATAATEDKTPGKDTDTSTPSTGAETPATRTVTPAKEEVPNKITFIRTITVGDTTTNPTPDGDKWTYTDSKGVVIVNKDVVATLHNDKNELIKNRQLASNSGWITGKYRVNENGVKQYQVSTHEWVSETDVHLEDKGSSSNGFFTEITKVPNTHVVSLGGITGYVYTLFREDGSVVKQRHLASGTAWRVDKVAKDADGNTYYRVSTNEWVIQGDGVSYK